jgi:hypothetical protein
MSFSLKAVADPAIGVASVAVATSSGQPGGQVLTEADVPALLVEGSSFEEIAALQLVTVPRLEEIAKELVQSGELPADRFTVSQ